MRDAKTIIAERAKNSEPEREADRLLYEAAAIVKAWTDPNVPAVATLRTCSGEAGEEAMAAIRALGYAANWVVNGDGEFRFALDPRDAPSIEDLVFGP